MTLFKVAAIVAIYSNLPAVAVHFHGVPAALANLVICLLIVPFVHETYIRRKPIVVDRTFRLMLGFLAVLFAASILARDMTLALERIGAYLAEGVALYFIVVNVFRDWPSVRRGISALLITGAFLGSLALYQNVTKDYTNTFGGLAQRKTIAGDIRSADMDRAQGPIGETNRFGQMLLVLLPPAFVFMSGGSSRRLRVGATITGMLIFLGILTTYSRGAMLAIAAMVVPMTCFGLMRVRTAMAACGIGCSLLLIVTPTYVERLATIGDVESDPVARSRLTEMNAAFHVFADYPLFGVGPGHYAPHYSMTYQLDPDIAMRHVPKPRRAHNMLAELGAETGIAGLVAFFGIVGSLMVQLYKHTDRIRELHPEVARLALAMWTGIFGYLVAATFLHLSYQRYYWLFLAFGGAMVRTMMELEREVEP